MNELPILERDLFEVIEEMLDGGLEPASREDFGSYRGLKILGEGGMGDVYVAEDTKTGRRVALKFLRGPTDPVREERFRSEIKSLAQLEHPFIARLYECAIHPDGTPFFSMEYLEGRPLDRFCEEKLYSVRRRIEILRLLCEAAAYAQARAVIHLDLKPSNILVTADGTPKLLDFGIAQRIGNPDSAGPPGTGSETPFTPAYAAPEQFSRQPLGTFTDVYSLGVLLYQLLTGTLPPRDEGAIVKPSKLGRGLRRGRADWEDLDRICLTALEREPAKRYQLAAEFGDDLDRYLKRKPIKVRKPSVFYIAGKIVQRNRWPLAGVATALVAIAVVSALYLYRMEKAREALQAEVTRTQRIQRAMVGIFGNTEAGPPEEVKVAVLLDLAVKNAKLLDKEPAAQADLYETFGGLYQRMSELDRADSLFQQALDRRKRVFGPNDTLTAQTLVAFSYLRIDQARFPEAEQMAREALAIYRHNAAPDGPPVGRALTALGAVMFYEARLNEGVNVLKQAVQILSGPTAEEADLVEALTYLANCYQHLGHASTATSLYKRVLNLDRRIYGDEHTQVAEDLTNLAESTSDLGRYAEAEVYDRESLQIERKWHGSENAETGLIAMSLGKTLILERKYEEGLAILRGYLSLFERTLGPKHPFVATDRQWMGVAEMETGHLAEAEADFTQMREISKSVFGDDAPHTGAAAFRFGELNFARKQYPQAEAFFREAVRRFTAAFGADNPHTASARVRLGGTLLRERKYREAETELEAGYPIVTSIDGYTPREAEEAKRDLVAVHRVLGDGN